MTYAKSMNLSLRQIEDLNLDMSDELFDGRVANNLSLAEAIIKKYFQCLSMCQHYIHYKMKLRI